MNVKMRWMMLVVGMLSLSSVACDKLKEATGTDTEETTVVAETTTTITETTEPVIEVADCPERFRELENYKPGDTMEVTCQCDEELTKKGSVWGGTVYTTDSSICMAAVHAGVIQQAAGGPVTVKGFQGCKAYEGKEANGVTSRKWQSFSGSFAFPSIGTPACPDIEVDEAMFISAYYETTCVQAKIADPGKQKEIMSEIHARYGFDADSFKSAQTSVGEQANVKLALESRMKDCTEEAAEGFAKAGSVAVTDEKEDPKDEKKTPPKPSLKYKVDTYTARGLSIGDINQGEIVVSFTKDAKVKGFFKGKREGKFFNIPLKGSIDKGGTFNANGRSGRNNVSVTGGASMSSATGQVQGNINSKGFKLRFTAKN